MSQATGVRWRDQLAMQCSSGIKEVRENARAILAEISRLESLVSQSRPSLPDMTESGWTVEQALRFYSEGRHFDVVDGHTRILDTGAVASDALKGMSHEYAERKGCVASSTRRMEITQKLDEPYNIPLPVRVEVENYPLGDTGDYTGHTYLVDAKGDVLAEWVDLESDAHALRLAEIINQSVASAIEEKKDG